MFILINEINYANDKKLELGGSFILPQKKDYSDSILQG